MTFSERLHNAMLEIGISQSELAILTGIGRARICEYLSGKSTPRPDKMCKLYEALDIESEEGGDYPGAVCADGGKASSTAEDNAQNGRYTPVF